MLEQYRKKRHFNKTREPSGAPPPASAATSEDRPGRHGLLFVIQKHAARRLHYDFRLELDGVLLSWAVPKGPSLDPHDRHLAARVEDHPLEYGSFEGTIPKGEYGAGTVELWDRGTWEPEGDAHEGLARGDLKFTLHGEKLRGSWVLVRMRPRAGEKQKEEWLLIKHGDEEAVDGDGQAILRDRARSVVSDRTLEEIAAEAGTSVWHSNAPADEQDEARPGEEFRLDPSRVTGTEKAAMPRFVRPELATLVRKAPTGDGWLHEVKFDGYRAIARVEGGQAELLSRNGKDWSERFRVLLDELAKLPVTSALLDGEAVVQMPDGTTSFQALQNIRGAAPPRGRLLYYVFDLLHLNGYDLTGAVIEERKELLRRLLLRAPADGSIRYTEHLLGQGEDFLEEACKAGLEGIVSKKIQTRYRPGVRSAEWLKTKCRQEQEFVIGGFTDPAGSRSGFGALLLGANDAGGLRYVGKVGTGFSEKLLRDLGQRLHAIEIDRPAFANLPQRTPVRTHWVKPELVAEVTFSEWTGGGGLRHPSFKGLREDKAPSEVVVERPAEVDIKPSTSAHASSEHDIKVTHPDRILWPTDGTTKLDLVSYYEKVAGMMLPYVVGRPLTMVRCPDGVKEGMEISRTGRRCGNPCFFYKHPGPDFPGPFRRLQIQETGGADTYLAIEEAESLTALAQMGVLEIHVWGSTWPDIERPDVLVFDLDPGPTVEWPQLAAGARLMRTVLRSLGLESFVKTTGGKGLHVVAPIKASEDWSEVHRFCKAAADALVARAPDLYTSNMSKSKRVDKIYVDYVRNNRGATSIAPYSTRARDHATVAVPLRWNDLGRGIRPDTYTLMTLRNRVARLKGDPWVGYFDLQNSQGITASAERVLGIV